jgi:hypothetical protein
MGIGRGSGINAIAFRVFHKVKKALIEVGLALKV